MKIEIGILDVTGISDTSLGTERPKVALEFLNKVDHEGSSLSLTISTGDSDVIYDLLNFLTKDR